VYKIFTAETLLPRYDHRTFQKYFIAEEMSFVVSSKIRVDRRENHEKILAIFGDDFDFRLTSKNFLGLLHTCSEFIKHASPLLECSTF